MLTALVNRMLSKWTVALMVCTVAANVGVARAECTTWPDSTPTSASLSGYWEVEYDLTGSEFETRNTPLGAADTTHVVGPGMMTIRFESDGSGPSGRILEGGGAQIVQLELTQQFVVQTQLVGFRADVTTRIRSSIPDNRWDGNPAGRVAPGSSRGTINGETMTISAPGMSSYHTLGSLLCEGSACRLGRMRSGVQKEIDSDLEDLDLRALYFGAGGPRRGAQFASNEIALPLTPRAAPYLRLFGREVGRIFVPPARTETALAARPCYSVIEYQDRHVEAFAEEP
jgi:hypothetical protein